MLEDFYSSVDSTENIYDLIACCCDSIFSVVSNESLFVSTYIDKITERENDVERKSNPNSDELDDLSNSIIEYLAQTMSNNPFSNYMLFKEFLLVCLGRVVLKDYNDPMYNKSTVPYVVLKTIDDFIPTLSQHLRARSGPAGNYKRYNTLVYPVGRNIIISTASKEHGFRKKVHPRRIQDIISSVRIVQKKQLVEKAGIPEVRDVKISKPLINSLINTQKFSIAFFPYSNILEFKFEDSLGSSFVIKYHDSGENAVKEYCHALLDCAVETGANIIAFPEYSISEKLLNEFKFTLKKRIIDNPGSLDSLILVIAGSTWDKSDNNIMHILDRFGNEIGQYYKFSPYTQEAESNRRLNSYEKCEKLTSPGKECTIANINGIGLILPAICRDVINEEYTIKLAELFHPSVILTPAWSLSVASFHERLKGYANKFHTISFLLNSCQAMQDRSRAFMCACVPKMVNTTVQGEIIDINTCCRKSMNCSDCGCVFHIEVNFGKEKEFAENDTENQVITWSQRKVNHHHKKL